jgi:hypothetical protein
LEPNLETLVDFEVQSLESRLGASERSRSAGYDYNVANVETKKYTTLNWSIPWGEDIDECCHAGWFWM